MAMTLMLRPSASKPAYPLLNLKLPAKLFNAHDITDTKLMLTLLGPQSRFGDKLFIVRVNCPHIWDCGAKGRRGMPTPVLRQDARLALKQTLKKTYRTTKRNQTEPIQKLKN